MIAEALLPPAPASALRKRRPVRVCFPFAGGAVGGSHISAVILIKALDVREFVPLVLLHRSEGPVVDLLRTAGVAFELAPQPEFLTRSRHGSLFGAFQAAALALRLARYLRRRDVAIVHTNDGPMHATWGLAARLAGARLLWHHRGNPTAAGLRYLAPWLANRVVAVSNFAAPRPGRLSAAAKCSVVPSPFQASLASDVATETALRAELGLAGTTRILGFFGNFTARKRPLVFVEAMAAIVARDPDLDVVGLMFGDVLDPGLDVAVAARIHELGLAGRVRVMGFRTPPEPWIALCDLMLVTAIEEPFGRTLIEAMMLGTPIIAAASGGNMEAIQDGETGRLVAPDDVPAFADAALALLREPATATRFAATARREVHERFSVARHVRSITSIYRELVAA